MGTIWDGSSQLPKRICHLRNSGDWHGLLSCLGFQKQRTTRATIDHRYSACNLVTCFGGERAVVCLLNASAQFCFWCLLKLKKPKNPHPHTKTNRTSRLATFGFGVYPHYCCFRHTENCRLNLSDDSWGEEVARDTKKSIWALWTDLRLNFLLPCIISENVYCYQLAVKEGGGKLKWQINRV